MHLRRPSLVHIRAKHKRHRPWWVLKFNKNCLPSLRASSAVIKCTILHNNMITHRRVKLCFPNAVRHRCKGIRDLIVNLLMCVQSPQTSSSLPLLYLRAYNEQKVKGALGFVQHILSLRFSLFSHMHHHHHLLLLTKSTKPRLPVFKVRVQLNFRNYLTFLSSLGSRLIQAKQKRWSVVLLTVGLLIFSFHGPSSCWLCLLVHVSL